MVKKKIYINIIFNIFIYYLLEKKNLWKALKFISILTTML